METHKISKKSLPLQLFNRLTINFFTNMKKILFFLATLLAPFYIFAGEADIQLPDFNGITFFDGAISGWSLLIWGSIIVVFGLVFGLYQAVNIKKYPVHKSMANISATIYET
jgi:K(+)-stimulated pyrophosphate-energized sodium pump